MLLLGTVDLVTLGMYPSSNVGFAPAVLATKMPMAQVLLGGGAQIMDLIITHTQGLASLICGQQNVRRTHTESQDTIWAARQVT